MIRHIFHLIWNQRKSNSWLLAELFLIFVCLWYIVDYFLTVILVFNTPVGFDTSHTYHFQFNAREEGAEGYVTDSAPTGGIGKELVEALERIRRMPPVESAALSYMALPYNQFFNVLSLSRDSVSPGVSCFTFYVTPDYFEVYRIQPASGSRESLSAGLTDGGVVLTQDAAMHLFDRQGAAGQTVYDPEAVSRRIGAVSQNARNSEFERVSPRVYLPLTPAHIEALPAAQLPWVDVSVRVKPETSADFAETFLRENSRQLELGNLYLQSITPLSAMRENVLRDGWSEINTRLSILLFLLINIFLGIVGTFWFRTRSRRGEMGLRMALGSTRRQLRRLMLGEGLLVLSLSFLPALAVCIHIAATGLISTKLMDNACPRFAGSIFITYLLMAVMVVLGIWYPASEAAAQEPVDTLHEE